MKIDWEAMRGSLEGPIKEQLNQLIGGAIEDLNGPARDAANRMAVAIRRGPAGADLVNEIADQLAVEALKQASLGKRAAQGQIENALGIGMNLLFAGATAALGSIRVN